MSVSVVYAAAGRPALVALGEAIGRAKGDDPLRAVTVAVPSNYAALSLRRALASGLDDAAGHRSPGLANVAFLSLSRVAELLGAPLLGAEGRRPVSPPLLAAALGAALESGPGSFAEVAGHPSTERALLATYRDLRAAGDETVERLVALGGRTADVIRLCREARDRLGAYYDEHDLARAAVAAVESSRRPADELGPLIIHLPERLDAASRGLVRALGRRGEVQVIAGLSGDPEADQPVVALARALGHRDPPPVLDPPSGTRTISAPDADEEVRSAIRVALGHLAAGLRLDRVAILHPTTDTYGAILHEQLAREGIPFNGPGLARLADSVVGCTLRLLLSLPDDDYSRDQVIALCASSPVRRADGTPVPASAWDDVSRRAGVVRGLGHWEERLGRLVADRRARYAAEPTGGEVSPSRRAGLRRQAEQAAELADFVAELARRIDGAPGTWAGLGEWCRELLVRYLGPESRRDAWPDAEVEAARQLDRFLDQLQLLDEVSSRPPTVDVLRARLETGLDEPTGRVGRFGVGIFVAPLSAARGVDLDAVLVVGLSEGRCPSRPGDDSILPDRLRHEADPSMPLRGSTVSDQHRQLLAALAAGRQSRVLLSPRGDSRRGRTWLPSRWLLDTERRLGRPPTVVPSFAGAVVADIERTGTADLDLHLLARAREAGLDPAEGVVSRSDPWLRAGYLTRRARRSHGFTRFDGNLSSVMADGVGEGGRLLSPTSLERYATCPFSFFLADVLRVGEVERPEDIDRLGPRDRGTLVHEVLERFLAEVVARPPAQRPGPTEPWADADRRRLTDLAAEVSESFEERGLTGRPLLWRRERRRILDDLLAFLDADDAYRRAHGARPERVELPFGLDQAPPVEVDAAGRVLRFRGRADRVDRTDDGRLVVIDYKTGRPDAYRDLDDGDPVARGTRLQLPLYALAAQQAVGDLPVTALYVFASRLGRFARHGYDVDDARLTRFRGALGRAVVSIEEGLFPPHPGGWDTYRDTHANCTFCAYDRLCPRDRGEQWQSLADAPELTGYVELAEGENPWEPPA